MRTIAHISDLHFGSHHSHMVDDLRRSLDEHRPDLVVFSGDFTQRARRIEFEQARDFLSCVSFPKIMVPGNHDVPLYNVFRRFLRPWSRFNHYIGSTRGEDNGFVDDEIAVLGLNSARSLTWKNGRISHEQLDLMRRFFESIPPGVFKIVMTHHPVGMPENASPRELAGRSNAVVEALAEVGVEMLLSGHHHRNEGGVLKLRGGSSVLVLHAGTAASSRTRAGEGNNYNLITIATDGVLLQLMTWTESAGFRRDESLRVDRWSR